MVIGKKMFKCVLAVLWTHSLVFTLSLISVAAGWNQFYGHNEHHHGSQHFGHYDYPHYGSHGSHHGSHHYNPHHEPAHFGPPQKHPHPRPPQESPNVCPHHESPHYESSHGYPHHRPHHGYTQHQGYNFGSPYHPLPYTRPPWERPDWDRPELGTKGGDDDTSSSSSLSEENNEHHVPSWYTLTIPQSTPPTSEQTTTRSVWNKPSSYRNTYSPRFPTVTMHRDVPTNTSTVSNSNSSIVDRCVISRQSIMTPEYNPVCGTNSITYQNIGLLLCAKACGVDVVLKRTSMCPDDELSDEDDISDSAEDTETTELMTSELTPQTAPPPSDGRTKMAQSIVNCMQTCPFTGEFSPVCGTNLVTYFNHDRFMCAKKCGLDVELKCRCPCATSHCRYEEIIPTTATTTTSSWNVPETRPPWPSVKQCLSTCAVSAEYNPVCGTNDITYGNPSKLQCAQSCGVDVSVRHQSSCSTNGIDNTTPYTTTTFATSGTTTLPLFTEACMRGCVVTPEYNPVCGTNNVTYTNPGRLECANMCGVDVKILYNSACEITDPNDITPSTESTRIGNDATEQTTTPGFTVEQSLLETIFGKTAATTQIVPTTEKVFDIDIRYDRL